ncbi:MAG: hypothetical protein ACQETD_09740, partial [Pseudomonadota bacterium]
MEPEHAFKISEFHLFTVAYPPLMADPLAIGVRGPYQANFSGGVPSVEIFSDSYNRDKYHTTGASMYVQTALTEYDRYFPEREYRWQFHWFYPSGRQRTNYFTYKPSLDCIVNDITDEAYCGVSATEVGTIKTFEVVTAVDQKCIAEEQEYLMAAMMDASVDVEWSYKPTPFRVGKPSIVLSKDEIHPKIRPGHTLNQEAIAAGATTMTATTLDAYGCEEPIPEVRVSVKNVLPEDSAGHYHMQEGSEGTGEYMTVKNGTHKMESDTAFTAVSDQSGKVVAEYQAGSLGVAENVMVTAYNRTNNGWPFIDNEALQIASAELAIKVPGLVHLDRGETTYTLQGSGSELDLLHNRSALRRNSHWVTPYVYTKAQQLSDAWSIIDPDGLPLCYNDGSL